MADSTTADGASIGAIGSVVSYHPGYGDYSPDWKMMRDCEAGERTVKFQREIYLPMPSGYKNLAQGQAMYDAYITRAQFPDILQPTLKGMVGVIHRVAAHIEGLEDNKPLAKIREKASKEGLTLDAFHKVITTELLLTGRYGILTDLPAEGGELPYFVGYQAESIMNWSEYDVDLYTLDESRYARDPNLNEFAWFESNRYRVLRLRDGKYSEQVYDATSATNEEEIFPSVRGGKQLTEIPFVVVNPLTISMFMEPPPLLGVARASLAIFRLDADYRHQLYTSGQETLAVIGDTAEPPNTVGSGVVIMLPTGGDAKFIGPSGRTIEAHRTAITDERENAVAAGVKLFDSKKGTEAAEALRLRAAAGTATLTTIAMASAAALEKALRYAAQFVGQNPDEIIVKPNLDFVENVIMARDVLALVQAWQGGGFSWQTLYEVLQRGEIASMDRTPEQERELMSQEALDNPAPPTAPTGRPQPQQEAAAVWSGERKRRPHCAAKQTVPAAATVAV